MSEEIDDKLSLLDDLQSVCTHCGLCSEGCATFQATGWEHESPRGRLQLAHQFLHGHIHPTSAALSTFDRCLGCRACEPLCPHQVEYHRVRELVQELRRDLQTSPISVIEQTQYQQWITLAQRIGNVWWRRYGAKWLKIPALDYRSKGSCSKKHKRSRGNQIVLAVCCVQDLFQHDVIEQTLSFMHRLGCSLEVDRKQPCCGAIFERLVRGGEETICYPENQRKAAALQNKTMKAFSKWLPSQTYFLAMGCQSFISRQNISTLDFYAWIETLLDQQQLILTFPKPKQVYYQPYCGSPKGMQDSVFRLLHRIQGLTVREISNPHTCCGGFCGESLLHPQHAQTLANQKISNLPDDAILVVTSPDCWKLFQSQSNSHSFTICYPIQLLTQAILT